MKYRWINGTDGVKYYDVGILADGLLFNPNGYPGDVVRAQVLAADERKRQRRSDRAKKGAATRARRRASRTHQVALAVAKGLKTGPRSKCWVCGRKLDDPTSKGIGIGSECWQEVLRAVEFVR